MIVVYTDEFNNSVKKLRDKIAIKRLNIVIEKLKNAKHFSEISNVIPIAGYIGQYRIRIGDYRLLVEYWAGEITILLLEYRKRNEKTYKKYR